MNSLLSLLIITFCLWPTVLAGFFYTESATCNGVRCSSANWVRFYGCSPLGGCDFLLQPWLLMLASFVVLSVLCSLLCSFLRCIFCGFCDGRRG